MPIFAGGAHPPDRKMPTSACPIEEAPLPKEVIVPLMQHFGRRARPKVKQGDAVVAGQLIG